MTKALTYYRLKEDDIGKDGLTKTKLITETVETYNVPNSVLWRRINEKLNTDEGQGVGTAISKENEEKLVT